MMGVGKTTLGKIVANKQKLKFIDIDEVIEQKNLTSISEIFKINISKFLSLSYIITKDIRFLNEFLYFYTDSKILFPFKDYLLHNFFVNIKENKTHKYVLHSKEEVVKNIDLITKSSDKGNVTSKICFLGYPHFFQSSYLKLKESGHNISMVFTPKPDGNLYDSLLNSNIFRKLYGFLYKVKYPYKVVKYDTTDKSLINYLKGQKYDYGFHKMNMIL